MARPKPDPVPTKSVRADELGKAPEEVQTVEGGPRFEDVTPPIGSHAYRKLELKLLERSNPPPDQLQDRRKADGVTVVYVLPDGKKAIGSLFACARYGAHFRAAIVFDPPLQSIVNATQQLTKNAATGVIYDPSGGAPHTWHYPPKEPKKDDLLLRAGDEIVRLRAQVVELKAKLAASEVIIDTDSGKKRLHDFGDPPRTCFGCARPHDDPGLPRWCDGSAEAPGPPGSPAPAGTPNAAATDG